MHRRQLNTLQWVLILSALPIRSVFAADSDNHCRVLPPPKVLQKLEQTTNTQTDPQAPNSEDDAQAPIQVSAEKSDAVLGDYAEFNGNVRFNQGNRHISADNARVDQQSERLDASGNLIFADKMFTITAESLTAEVATNEATLSQASYWLNGKQIHGDAEQLQVTAESDLILNGTNFTTCPPESQSWLLEAQKIEIDSSEAWGKIWGAKLRLWDVPVFYMPYMTIPVSDQRKSGFLFPSLSTSTTNGVEVALPYYWNISPQFDATITPHVMTNRGLFLKTEFRYLAGEDQRGQINIEYLPDDRKLATKPDRYLYHFNHSGKINEDWRVLASFTDVSDNNYFNDLKSDVSRSTDNQLMRVGEVSYFQPNWNVSAKVQDIKVLGENEVPHQVMPQLTYTYNQPALGYGTDFEFYSEMTNFAHRDSGMNTATRLHFEPTVRLPYQTPSGSLIGEVKLMQTFYEQNDPMRQLNESVSRTIPQVRIHGKMNLERDTTWFEAPYRQTLEPQMQYLYVGYQDQSGIGLYDTGLLYDDYYGLFRDRRFSGLDRIADANQITLGVTSRWFDEANVEAGKISLGQIQYLRNSRVSLTNEVQDQSVSSSALAAEFDFRLVNDWYWSSAVQYNTTFRSVARGQTSLDFRPHTNKLFQLNYRYVPDIADEVDISQAGVRAAWPIREDLHFVGNFYYDMRLKRAVETYAGFQYESCCWAIRLAYRHYLKTNYEDPNLPPISPRETFESGIYLNFVIKGLGGSGPLGISDMLDEGLFNYRRPLYLKN
ncbi:LPS assembly protein LptD [Paraferrimonas sedimenticola]|uniref:LPS-assembly protein LptD n=1 Tax=Paraferrimonas sedimenticola TaxID=375674 RepID=A0AA37RX74_9GAMM|nr:LPS assembly protein LptD [Paraferrimonas sedimenticola]GLP97340.1 LPS-assembly protein LptD [Paraferrimonas sedimenticola]